MPNPNLIIANYFDALTRAIDIYTETKIEEQKRYNHADYNACRQTLLAALRAEEARVFEFYRTERAQFATLRTDEEVRAKLFEKSHYMLMQIVNLRAGLIPCDFMLIKFGHYLNAHETELFK
jgi:hypothetical protein